jgi:AbrB family looped-hinge helix DNA binding protein
MITTIVTVKGQIVIPAKIRRHLNIKKGTRLSVIEGPNEIVLKPLTREYFANMAGIAGTKGKGLAALLEERAREKEQEDRKWSRS